MTTLPDYIDDLRRQQRAVRHTVSLVLGVHAVALASLAVMSASWPTFGGLAWQMVTVPGVYVTLWIVVRIRQPLTGMGGGRDDFGVMAVLAGTFVLLWPLSTLAVFMLGAGTVLGIGLVVLGARLQARVVWVLGLVLVATCPLVALGTFDNHAGFLGDQPGTVVLALLAAALGMASARAYRSERSTARELLAR